MRKGLALVGWVALLPLVCCLCGFAGGTPGGMPTPSAPDAPIDGGAVWLAVGGLAFGLYRLWRKRGATCR